jgi:hypothetical protein
MEIAVFEIWFIQDRRLELTCVSIERLGWLRSTDQLGDSTSQDRPAMKRALQAGIASFDGPFRRDGNALSISEKPFGTPSILPTVLRMPQNGD